MRIAIVGSGISGLTAAYKLSKWHDVVLYEANASLGGHTATKIVSLNEKQFAIDTGFIVFNDWTYPNFINLLQELNVESQPTSMGFSVVDTASGFEYAGNSLNTLFSQRKNLLSPTHWRMLRDIVRFNKSAVRDLEQNKIASGQTLGEYLFKGNYSSAFIERYLIPMGSAIWSSTEADMREFPLQFFVRFFKNHGLLNIKERPQWRVIKGGSHSYIAPLVERFKNKIRLGDPVAAINRRDKVVEVRSAKGINEFDAIVLACHSDQARSILMDASDTEKDILNAINYQVNDVCLHTDTRFLPGSKRAWSSWNYYLDLSSAMKENPKKPICVDKKLPILTYNMNILQGIDSRDTDGEVFCVTLNNNDGIDSDKVLGRYQYSHPVFSLPAIEAQSRWDTISGVNRTYFCGAYWLNGFHEDGVNSALRVVEQIQGSA